MRWTIVMVADIPVAADKAFEAYESEVLPLLPRHDGRLERRLRTTDETMDAITEVHIVSFRSREDFQSYLADEERQSKKDLLNGLDIAQRTLVVHDL